MCRIRTCAIVVLSFSLLGVIAAPTHAVFRIWDPVGFSFDWQTATNWDPTGVPTTSDDLQISGAGLTTLSADTALVNSLVMTGGVLQTNGHTLIVDDSGNGLLTLTSAGVGTPSLSVFPTDDGNDALSVDDARILGGSLVLNNDGTTATVDFSLEIGPNGTLRTSGIGTTTITFGDSFIGTSDVFTNDGTVNVNNGSTLHLKGLGVPLTRVRLGSANSTVDINTNATLILDTLALSFPFEGTMTVDSGGVLRTTNPTDATNFVSSGEIILNDGELAGDRVINTGIISGQGSITTDRVTTANGGTITGIHSVTTTEFVTAGGAISAVAGTISIGADMVRVRDDSGGTIPGVLNAVQGDIELIGVTDGIVESGGEVHVAAGHEFRLTSSQLVFQSGSVARFMGGGTIVGSGFTFPGFDFEPGSLIQVDSGAEARLENFSVFTNNSRLAGDVVLNDDLRLVRPMAIESTSTFTGSGSLIIDPSSTIVVDDGVSFEVAVVNEGRLFIEADLGVGQISMTSNYTQADTGTLDIDLNSIVAGEFDVVTVDANVVLDGTLEVHLTPGFNAVVGNTFTILTSVFGLVTQEFETEDVPIFDGLTFAVNYNPSSVVLEVVEAGLLGDFDEDGDVDGKDFLKWQRGDLSNPPSASDLDDWEANYGMTAPLTASSTAAVPEPTTLATFVIFVLLAVSFWGPFTTGRDTKCARHIRAH